MLDFYAKTPMGSDCTCAYSVKFFGQLTVKQLIKEILSRKEWGYVDFFLSCRKEDNNCSGVEYKYNELLHPDENFKEIQDYLVVSISAAGGWTRMDYQVSIKKPD